MFLRSWDYQGNPLAVFDGHQEAVVGAMSMPNDQILSWSLDQTLRAWSLDGGLLETFEGHQGKVLGAELLPDGNILSWSEDQTFRKWIYGVDPCLDDGGNGFEGHCKTIID